MFSEREHRIDLAEAQRPIEEVDADSAEETNELMDPVSLRLMIVPLKPCLTIPLQAVELGSLIEQLRIKGGASTHPLNPKLRLTEEYLKNYVVDQPLIERRNAYLAQEGYSLANFLAYRGLTRAEYQRLLKLFQPSWLLEAADWGLLGLVSLAGIGGYLYGRGTQNLFFSSTFCNPDLTSSYKKLQGVAGSISILNTLGAHFAWNKNKNARETMGITGVACLMSLILLFSEVHVITQDKALEAAKETQQEEPHWVISRIMAKVSIPFLQGGCLLLGKSWLNRFSLFSKNKELLNNYTKREALEPARNDLPRLEQV